MPIDITCRCQRSLRLKDDLAGKMILCPDCQATLRVPAPAEPGDPEAVIEEGLNAAEVREKSKSRRRSRQWQEFDDDEEMKEDFRQVRRADIDNDFADIVGRRRKRRRKQSFWLDLITLNILFTRDDGLTVGERTCLVGGGLMFLVGLIWLPLALWLGGPIVPSVLLLIVGFIAVGIAFASQIGDHNAFGE